MKFNRKFLGGHALSLCFLLFTPVFGSAQVFTGLHADSRSGVNAVMNNPAALAGSPFIFDMNLAGFDLKTSNNYLQYDWRRNESNILDSESYAMDVQSLAMGPSFMLRIKNGGALALHTAVHSYASAQDVSPAIMDALSQGNLNHAEGQLDAAGMAWGEIGLTYSGELLGGKKHKLYGGVTFKIIQELANAQMEVRDLSIEEQSNSVHFTGTAQYALNYPSHLSEVRFQPNGLGINVGLSYHYKPLPNEAPRLKLDFALMNLGNVRRSDATLYQYALDGVNMTKQQWENMNSLDDFNESFRAEEQQLKRARIPGNMNLGLDLRLFGDCFVNAWAHYQLSDLYQAQHPVPRLQYYSVSPRWEGKYFALALPYTRKLEHDEQLGIALRMGPVYLGSGRVLSNLWQGQISQSDIYMGLKISIARPQKTDNRKSLQKTKFEENTTTI